MSLYRKNVGATGEQVASDFLIKKAYKILATNFRSRFGEIDIIAFKKNKISFIEVKTRLGNKKGKPYEAISKRKIIHLKKAAQYYLLINHCKQYKLSLEAISITLDDNFKPIKIDHFENIETQLLVNFHYVYHH